MLGWVITCHDEQAQDMLLKLESRFGPLARIEYEYAQPDDVRCAA